ncbi:NAD(P)/FAD-dependent oxidoreductase [Streptomyces milbemycinicus]|uniref:NAD(P)/FAD-dependent oxidoreductase n=1 Tax=Streptomyces milbemycinicus TaxID=476552 RepID=A0ABW8LZY3_9ACTN
MILLAHSAPAEGADLARLVEAHFYGKYQVLLAPAPAQPGAMLEHLDQEGRRVAAVLVDERLPDDAKQTLLPRVPQECRLLLAHRPGVEQGGVRSVPRALGEREEDFWVPLHQALYDTVTPDDVKATVRGNWQNKRFSTILRFLLLNLVTCKLDLQPDATDVKVDLTVGTQAEQHFTNPTLAQLVAPLGLNTYKPEVNYDVVIVGGGPASLSAAVNLTSLFQLKVLIIEKFALGGEAATAINTIENYLGFPKGISAYDLARLWRQHTDKYDTYIHRLLCYSAKQIQSTITAGKITYTLTASPNEDERVTARPDIDQDVKVTTGVVLIASGLKPRRLAPSTQAQEYEGQGVYYDALPGDTDLYDPTKDTIAIVGAGDTAGRAAALFAAKKIHVDLLVRGDNLNDMIPELRAEIANYAQAGTIKINYKTEVTTVAKNSTTHKIQLTLSSASSPLEVSDLYVLIGGQADTKWLDASGVDLQKCKGEWFGCVRTGADVCRDTPDMQSSLPGVFAAGDVRSGSVRRISAAVGEGGAVAIAIYKYFTTKPKVLQAAKDTPTSVYFTHSP